jgi:hypothetical protein
MRAAVASGTDPKAWAMATSASAWSSFIWAAARS